MNLYFQLVNSFFVYESNKVPKNAQFLIKYPNFQEHAEIVFFGGFLFLIYSPKSKDTPIHTIFTILLYMEKNIKCLTSWNQRKFGIFARKIP